MLTDTHCHVYHEYYDDIDKIFLNAKYSLVTRFFLSGCTHESNMEVISTLNNYDFVYGYLGLHPEVTDSYTLEQLKYIEQNFSNPKIIGIGEIGLDYHYTKENKEEQKKLFELQMDLAARNQLPVVIHSREATEDTINILKKYPSVKGVIHSFSGSLETAQIYIKMGYKLGINGVVTFKNSHLKEIIPDIIDSIILETDSPYLTPHPYRGTKNEPKYIHDIALYLCEISHISFEKLTEITNRNILEIFDI